MKNYLLFALAVSTLSSMAFGMTIPCNSDGVTHELRFNQGISTSEGVFYSFIGEARDKKIHLLYPSTKDQKISLSILKEEGEAPDMKLFPADTRSLKLEAGGFTVICTNPETYNPNFLSRIQKVEEVNGEFMGLINSKYKKKMINKILGSVKTKDIAEESELRAKLDAYLIATGINYQNEEKKNIGTFSISWGYHRDFYAQSDVRIWNEKTGTDFMAYDVDAVDASGFDMILPRKGHPYYLDVPQYQVRIAYMLPDGKWGVELSQEHLKYKMKQRDDDFNFIGQDKHIKGNYFGEDFDGIKNIARDDEFYFEHTDGLNPMSANIIRNFNLTNGKMGSVDLQATVGAGIILPATMSVIKGELRDDKFSIVGYDVSTAGRIRYTYGPVYLQAGIKYHHIDVVKGKLAGDNHLHQNINAVVFGADFGVSLNFNKKIKKKAL